MPAQWKMLAWKEWRERSGAFLVWSAVVLLIVWRVLAVNHAGPQSFLFVSYLSAIGVLAAVYMALQTTTSCRENQVQDEICRLPFSVKTHLQFKVTAGLLTLIIPPVVGAFVVWGGAFGFPREQATAVTFLEDHYRDLDLTPIQMTEAGIAVITGCLAAAQIAIHYLLFCVASSFTRSMNAAVVASAVTHAAYVFLQNLGVTLIGNGDLNSIAKTIVLAISPETNLQIIPYEGGIAPSLLESSFSLWGSLVFVQIALLAVTIRLVRRNQREASLPRLGRPSESRSLLAMISSFQFISLIWLAAWSVLPICLLMTALTAPQMLLMTARYQALPQLEHLTLLGTRHAVSLFTALWPIVVGAVVFSPESRRGLREFLQSRPIPIKHLFFWKYTLGLAGFLCFQYGPAMAFYACTAVGEPTPLDQLAYWLSEEVSDQIPVQILLYSLVVALTCWTKSPVYCGFTVLSLSVFLGAASLGSRLWPMLYWLSLLIHRYVLRMDMKTTTITVWSSPFLQQDAVAIYPLALAILLSLSAALVVTAYYGFKQADENGISNQLKTYVQEFFRTSDRIDPNVLAPVSRECGSK